MKLGIFGGANPSSDRKLDIIGDKMGELLAKQKIEVILGCNTQSVMGKIYQHYFKNNLPNTLVIPKIYSDEIPKLKENEKKAGIIGNCTIIQTGSIQQRTEKILELSDSILVMPGGIGTAYEFLTAIENSRTHEKPLDKIIILNWEGYWDSLLDQIDFIIKQGFTKQDKGISRYRDIQEHNLFFVANTAKEVIKILKETRGKTVDF